MCRGKEINLWIGREGGPGNGKGCGGSERDANVHVQREREVGERGTVSGEGYSV